MTDIMKKITLAQRPVGEPGDECFKLEEAAVPTPKPGEVVVRVHYMSLDPYMRGRMDDAKSYAAPVPLGGTMEGGGVGEVIATEHPKFSVGDQVFGMFGWATHGCLPGDQLQKLDPNMQPMSLALGALGMPGFTGWYGLTQIGKPKEGETLVVAAATGPVGSMVGQLAKLKGLQVIGIAGGKDKCDLAVNEFGFDACLDHRAYEDARTLRKALAEHCPQGVDIYFENVGGKVLEAVLPLMNTFGRIPICGMISGYNEGALGGVEGPGQDRFPVFWRTMLVKRMAVEGFIISDQWGMITQFIQEVAPLVMSGKVKFKEDVAEGLENAPETFRGLLKGRNFGKQVVKLV